MAPAVAAGERRVALSLKFVGTGLGEQVCLTWWLSPLWIEGTGPAHCIMQVRLSTRVVLS